MLPNANSRRIAIWLVAAAALGMPTISLANIPSDAPAKLAAGPAMDGVEVARRGRGADDGANHDKNDDHGKGHRGRGADDGRGHDKKDDHGKGRRGRGKDDGPRHSAAPATQSDTYEMARRGRGKDDAPGHSRHGRGKDDGPNHG